MTLWTHVEPEKLHISETCACFWLFIGLESLFHLTLRKRYELLVDMEDFSRNVAFARYSSFSINPESDGYRLHVSGFINGGAGGEVFCSDSER